MLEIILIRHNDFGEMDIDELHVDIEGNSATMYSKYLELESFMDKLYKGGALSFEETKEYQLTYHQGGKDGEFEVLEEVSFFRI